MRAKSIFKTIVFSSLCVAMGGGYGWARSAEALRVKGDSELGLGEQKSKGLPLAASRVGGKPTGERPLIFKSIMDAGSEGASVGPPPQEALSRLMWKN